ncbi:hypothetical protein A2U01_0089626, partial [Trifolium medium]|nr:hypothetical protein [Trifolium medium]
FCRFWYWRNAHSCVAQCAVLFCFSGFLLAAARGAGVPCAARRVALLGLGVFWFLRGAQVGAAPRAELS